LHTASATLAAVGRPIILYDADCGFCKWALARVLAWDRAGKLRPVALQSPEAEALLPGMDAEERMRSWHLVTPEGEVRSAGAAFEPLVEILGRGRPLGAFARRFPRATDAAYRWVAEHRTWFGKLTRGRRAAAERCIEQRARPVT
jgi:predicted DCC family thiol-disulfide oxidoreductase YuxK